MTLDQLREILEEARRSNVDAFSADETFVRRQVPLEAPPAAAHSESDQETELFPRALADLSELIPEEEQKRFIRKIFRKDDTQFTNTVNALNGMTSWKEASAYIDKLLVANDVDPYSSEAVRFSEIVQRRFFPRITRR